jgi:hypothetical protein
MDYVWNYRPISILLFFSKALEKLMYNRLTSFVIKEQYVNGGPEWF